MKEQGVGSFAITLHLLVTNAFELDEIFKVLSQILTLVPNMLLL